MRVNKRVVASAVIVAAGAAWFLFKAQPAGSGRAGPPIVSVTVPALSGGAAEGEIAFNDNCAVCHGKDAAGQEGVAPPLVHKIYEPNHHGDMAFVVAARRGVRAHHWPFGDMPPVPDVTDEELVRIVTYVRTLQRANGIF